jgi:hypothetical protein
MAMSVLGEIPFSTQLADKTKPLNSWSPAEIQISKPKEGSQRYCTLVLYRNFAANIKFRKRQTKEVEWSLSKAWARARPRQRCGRGLNYD